jgi:hypothetical protein
MHCRSPELNREEMIRYSIQRPEKRYWVWCEGSKTNLQLFDKWITWTNTSHGGASGGKISQGKRYKMKSHKAWKHSILTVEVPWEEEPLVEKYDELLDKRDHHYVSTTSRCLVRIMKMYGLSPRSHIRQPFSNFSPSAFRNLALCTKSTTLATAWQMLPRNCHFTSSRGRSPVIVTPTTVLPLDFGAIQRLMP